MSNNIYIKNNQAYIGRSIITIDYLAYATESDSVPLIASCNANGVGSPGSSGNFANYDYGADWNSSNGNVTTVGTNGAPSFLGTFDQSGQVWEWNDAVNGSARGVRGGSWLNTSTYIGASYRGFTGAGPSFGNANVGFRICASRDVGSTFVDLISIGYTNNANDSLGFGSVSYEYKIGKYPITNSQYCSFLNLKAISDPYNLYNTNMGSSVRGGIDRSGTSGNYAYSLKTNMADKPVVYISWYDAARFVNWLHNGGGSGNTESGAYNLGGASSGIFYKNEQSLYWIPTEDEWYKAAFYKQDQSYKIEHI